MAGKARLGRSGKTLDSLGQCKARVLRLSFARNDSLFEQPRHCARCRRLARRIRQAVNAFGMADRLALPKIPANRHFDRIT